MHFIEVLCPATHFIETSLQNEGQDIPGITGHIFSPFFPQKTP